MFPSGFLMAIILSARMGSVVSPFTPVDDSLFVMSVRELTILADSDLKHFLNMTLLKDVPSKFEIPPDLFIIFIAFNRLSWFEMR